MSEATEVPASPEARDESCCEKEVVKANQLVGDKHENVKIKFSFQA